MSNTNLQQAIYKRKSRRTYLSTPIKEATMNRLLALIRKYNEESQLSMQIIEDGSEVFSSMKTSYGFFKGVKTIIVLKGKKTDPNLLEKAGYYGEYLMLEATQEGLGSCWVGGTMDKDSPILAVAKDESLVCVITLGYTKEQPSFRENMISKMAHRKTKPLESFFISDTPTPPEWFLQAVKATQLAPSALYRQKYKFQWKEGEVTAISENSRFSDMTDLGIAKAHFEIVAGGYFDWGTPGLWHNEERNLS